MTSHFHNSLFRARNRHSYYEGQDRRDNFQMPEAPSVPTSNKRGSQDEYSNYRNSRGGGGRWYLIKTFSDIDMLIQVFKSRELRRGQSFGHDGGFENSRGDPRRSGSPQSLQWRNRGGGGLSNSSRNSSPARSPRGKGNSRNNSPHGRFDTRALFTESSFQKFLFFLLSVPEATLDETPLTAAPVPHLGKQGFSGELAARGLFFFSPRFYLEQYSNIAM